MTVFFFLEKYFPNEGTLLESVSRNENTFDGESVSQKVCAKRLGVQETGYMI